MKKKINKEEENKFYYIIVVNFGIYVRTLDKIKEEYENNFDWIYF